jgi:hypothetical protein
MCSLDTKTGFVIAGLDPAIHHFETLVSWWMPGSSPGMTIPCKPDDKK